MNSNLLREVWEMLDRDHLAEVARRGRNRSLPPSAARISTASPPRIAMSTYAAHSCCPQVRCLAYAPDETITIEDKTTIDLDWVAARCSQVRATDDEPQWLRTRAALTPARGRDYSSSRRADAAWPGLRHETDGAPLSGLRAGPAEAAGRARSHREALTLRLSCSAHWDSLDANWRRHRQHSGLERAISLERDRQLVAASAPAPRRWRWRNAITFNTEDCSTVSKMSYRKPTTRATSRKADDRSSARKIIPTKRGRASAILRGPSSERAHGYDTKHAMHLIRLMRMGFEVLKTGELHVRRDDAAQLSAIRDGALSFDELLVMAADLQQSMQNATAATELPHDVDYDRVDALLAMMLA